MSILGIDFDEVMMVTEAQLRATDAAIAALPEAKRVEAQERFAEIQSRLNEDDVLLKFAGVRVVGSTAIVPIRGTMTKRPSWLQLYGLATSNDLLAATFKLLAADDSIKRVYLDIDSGGGSVHGLELAARAMRELSAVKHTEAFFNDVAASAAFYVGSAARKRNVTPSSITGSIGTLVMIPDHSEQLKAAGIKIHVVRSGEFKALLNGVEPVSKKAIEEVEKTVKKYHNDFVKAVATHLNISQDEASKLADGRTYDGTDAIEVGLADAEMTLEETLATIEQEEALEAKLTLAQDAIAQLTAKLAERDEQVSALEAKVAELEAQAEEAKAAQVKAEAERTVDAAIESGRIPAAKREKYVTMAVEKGVEFVADLLADLQPGVVLPQGDIEEDTNAQADDPNAPTSDVERAVYAQFDLLREKYLKR